MADSERIANLETAVKLLAERCDVLLRMVTELSVAGRDLTLELLKHYGLSDADISAEVLKQREEQFPRHP